MKPGRLNASPDQLSQIEIGKEKNNIEYIFLDVQLFRINMVDGYYD